MIPACPEPERYVLPDLFMVFVRTIRTIIGCSFVFPEERRVPSRGTWLGSPPDYCKLMIMSNSFFRYAGLGDVKNVGSQFKWLLRGFITSRSSKKGSRNCLRLRSKADQSGPKSRNAKRR